MKINVLNIGKKISVLVLFTAIIINSGQMFATNASAFSGQGTWLDEGNYDISWYENNKDDQQVGIESQPYIISSANDLAGLAFLVNSGNSFEDKFIKLEQTIDDMSAHIWVPIGFSFFQFSGTFDGKLNKVSKIFTDENKNSQGLFGISNGLIKNITVTNSDIKGGDYVGGVVGCNHGTIENSYNTGSVTGSGFYVGGIVGFNSGKIKSSANTGDIIGTNHVGGVAGYNQSLIKNSHNKGHVTGKNSVGGIAGYNNSQINNVYNRGDIKGVNWIGGVAGSNSNTIENSYNVSSIIGDSHVGRVVGFNTGQIKNSYYCNNVGEIKNKDNDLGIQMSKAEMQKEEYSYLLGKRFASFELINDGFPILTTQKNKDLK